MKIILTLVIFFLVLFIYLHIQFHLKKSEDLEMYEMDAPSKDKLEEICDLRQPILFDFDCDNIIAISNRTHILNNYPSFDIKIRDIKDEDTNHDLYIPLPVNAAIELFNENKNNNYFSEKNMDFLKETTILKILQKNDDFLRPTMLSNRFYDVIIGGNNIFTPLRYEINYRNYFVVTEGSVKIKLTPPNSKKHLFPIYDYENFEFKSLVNTWNPQSKYLQEFNKIKCLEFTLTIGKTLFLPPYWWYSIQFIENASITCFQYRTYMNNLAVLPYTGLHFLQMQNIKRKFIKHIVTNNEIKEEPLENTEIEFGKTEEQNTTTQIENVEVIDKTINNNLDV